MGKFDLLFRINKQAINLAGLSISVWKLPEYYKLKKLLKRNEELAQYKKSDKCYVCGLGPSLKAVDLKSLDGDTIVVNRFNNYDKENEISPTYYCVTDKAFLNSKYRNELFNAIKSYKDTKFFLNSSFHRILNDEFINNKNLYYSCNWKGWFNHKEIIDYSKIVPAVGNVVCYAISLALYLGYKEIVLIGCDFNSFASPKATHCYEEDDDSRKISLSFELFCYSFVADLHYQLEKYAKENNVKIINATPGSLIDAYDRDDNYV